MNKILSIIAKSSCTPDEKRVLSSLIRNQVEDISILKELNTDKKDRIKELEKQVMGMSDQIGKLKLEILSLTPVTPPTTTSVSEEYFSPFEMEDDIEEYTLPESRQDIEPESNSISKSNDVEDKS